MISLLISFRATCALANPSLIPSPNLVPFSGGFIFNLFPFSGGLSKSLTHFLSNLVPVSGGLRFNPFPVNRCLIKPPIDFLS